MNPGLARFIASGAGSGYAPKAPGTAGSALGVILGAALLHYSPLALAAAAVLAILGGIPAIQSATALPFLPAKNPSIADHQDPGWIVIDEIAGQFIAMLALNRPSVAGLAIAFILFRAFDITKPGPIGALDRQGGAFGIMADDVLAGIFATVLLLVIKVLFPQLV